MSRNQTFQLSCYLKKSRNISLGFQLQGKRGDSGGSLRLLRAPHAFAVCTTVNAQKGEKESRKNLVGKIPQHERTSVGGGARYRRRIADYFLSRGDLYYMGRGRGGRIGSCTRACEETLSTASEKRAYQKAALRSSNRSTPFRSIISGGLAPWRVKVKKRRRGARLLCSVYRANSHTLWKSPIRENKHHRQGSGTFISAAISPDFRVPRPGSRWCNGNDKQEKGREESILQRLED